MIMGIGRTGGAVGGQPPPKHSYLYQTTKGKYVKHPKEAKRKQKKAETKLQPDPKHKGREEGTTASRIIKTINQGGNTKGKANEGEAEREQNKSITQKT